jgi:hypothetical protein
MASRPRGLNTFTPHKAPAQPTYIYDLWWVNSFPSLKTMLESNVAASQEQKHIGNKSTSELTSGRPCFSKCAQPLVLPFSRAHGAVSCRHILTWQCWNMSEMSAEMNAKQCNSSVSARHLVHAFSVAFFADLWVHAHVPSGTEADLSDNPNCHETSWNFKRFSPPCLPYVYTPPLFIHFHQMYER